MKRFDETRAAVRSRVALNDDARFVAVFHRTVECFMDALLAGCAP
jgi:hypothetical protein